MKFNVPEKEPCVSIQQAKRLHSIFWGRYKFIHAGYMPIRFRNFKDTWIKLNRLKR